MSGGRGKKSGSFAGVTGAGVGTGLLGLAQMIPENRFPALRGLCIYAAPAVTVFVGIAFAALRAWITGILNDKNVNAGLLRVRALRDAAVNDPNASDAHKARLQASVEEFEKLAVEIAGERVKDVRVSLSAS